MVARQGDIHRTASFSWFSRPHLDPASVRSYPAPRPDDPALLAALATVEGRRFLGWARFPRVEVEDRAGGAVVHLIDLRYRERPGTGFGSVTIPLEVSRK